MRRAGSQIFIIGYLAILLFGVWCQLTSSPALSHPAMYFAVWDMYGGFSPFEERHHLIAEGESGAYYEVTSPPWEHFVPFGAETAGRLQYDFNTVFSSRLALHVLNRTSHEPITRILLVDEVWNRKYNLSESVWSQRYDEERIPRSYHYLRAVYDPAGSALTQYCDFRSNLAHQALLKNPELQETIARLQPYSSIRGLDMQAAGKVQPASYTTPLR